MRCHRVTVSTVFDICLYYNIVRLPRISVQKKNKKENTRNDNVIKETNETVARDRSILNTSLISIILSANG